MDREKAIIGLKCLITDDVPCDGCPYYGSGYCTKNIASDAITLLKEQEEQEKRILSIVWDVLHSGVSTDTKADQDCVYELILEKVENYDKDVKRNG